MNVQTEIAPHGSSLYYSVLHCDEITRNKIIALRGFYAKIREIALNTQNISLTEIKFQWWRDELNRLKSQETQHPITKILQKNFSDYTDLDIELKNILDAFAKDIQISLYENQKDLDNFYLNTAGLLENIIAKIQGVNYPTEHLGVFVQKVLDFRDLRQAISRGKIYLSGEELLSHRVTLYELSQLKLNANIYNLFKTHADNIRKDLNFSSCLPRDTLILTKIYFKLLDEIEKTNFQILTHHINLTPLRKWWISWRT